MTEEQIQTQIHYMYEGDSEVPTSSDEDYILRRGLINAGINRWENENGILWNELWVKVADASDGDKTTDGTSSSFDCPTDFKFPGGYVRIQDSDGNETYYSVVKQEKLQMYTDSNKKVCYFTGNPSSGYDLNFLSAPPAGTLNYEYYKTAEQMDAATDVPEMSDPYFLVYFVISRLFEMDGQTSNSMKAFQEAEARLIQMKTRNMQSAWYQDSRVEDKDFADGVQGFGL